MKKWITVLLLLSFISCSEKKEKMEISFYYWRTLFELTPLEKQYLKELEVKKLYVRYFDVGLYEQEPVPIAPVVFREQPLKLKIIPVVYIKNEVFLQKIQTDSLAGKVSAYIKQINDKAGISTDEIQFDCDWSPESRNNYFQFILDFKKKHPKLSATIRLHQVKYPKTTGIPAVEEGALMYYNMGVIGASNENSIYDEKIARRYTASLRNYTLPLSIALPIFSWGVHIRNQQVTNLIGGLREKDLLNDEFEKIGKNRYRVKEDVLFKGRYLAKNDEIKIEEAKAEELKGMVRDIEKNSRERPKTLIFYDLNESNLTSYEKEFFKTAGHW